MVVMAKMARKGRMMHAFTLGTQEVEAGESAIQGHPWLESAKLVGLPDSLSEQREVHCALCTAQDISLNKPIGHTRAPIRTREDYCLACLGCVLSKSSGS